jgi:hypothetical protein
LNYFALLTLPKGICLKISRAAIKFRPLDLSEEITLSEFEEMIVSPRKKSSAQSRIVCRRRQSRPDKSAG